MYKLRFTGTIYPTAIKTSMDNHPTINWKSADLGFSLACNVTIHENKVTIDCDVDNSIEPSVRALRAFVLENDSLVRYGRCAPYGRK